MSHKLIVVGNGMAGVRAVEEILARGGGETFDITMFGDEPYGNYNRILLSNVLAGSDDKSEIYLNALDWYTDNDIDLRAGVRVVRLDAYRTPGARRRRIHHLLRHVDPGHRQPVFLSSDGRAVGRRQDVDRRRVRVPHTRRLHGHDRTGRGPVEGGRDRWWPARAGSRSRTCRIGALPWTSCMLRRR